MFRILHDTKYDFIKWWKQGLFIRVGFIVVGLLFLAIKGLDFSIEFTGGTVMQVRFNEPPGDAKLRDVLHQAGVRDAEPTQFGSNREFMIKARGAEGSETGGAATETVKRQIEGALTAAFGANTYEVLQSESIGPRVGAELRRNAFLAMGIAFLVTLAYLAMRFEWRFGLAAIVANAHEVLATFAFIALMNIEFSLTVLAAILTVIGYSLSDTIIIFDRVRENLRKTRRESLRDTVNRSINETLPRSVLTHVTVLAAALALLIFAGPVIRPFSWILVFGVTTATFTSIYISGALLLWIEQTWPRADVVARLRGTPDEIQVSAGRGQRPPAAAQRPQAARPPVTRGAK